MEKKVKRTSDGRMIIRRVQREVKRRPAPKGFRILFAYGEKCLANPDMMKDHNLTILGIVADAKQPFVGYFTEVIE